MEQQQLKEWETLDEDGEVDVTSEAWNVIQQLAYGVKNLKTSINQETINRMKNDPQFMAKVKNQKDDLLKQIKESVKFSKNSNTKYFEKKGSSDLPMAERIKKNFLDGPTSQVELHIDTLTILYEGCVAEEAIDFMIKEFVKEVKKKLDITGKAYKIKNKEIHETRAKSRRS